MKTESALHANQEALIMVEPKFFEFPAKF